MPIVSPRDTSTSIVVLLLLHALCFVAPPHPPCPHAPNVAATGSVGSTPDAAELVFPASVGAFNDLTDLGITRLLRWYNLQFPAGHNLDARVARRTLLRQAVTEFAAIH